MYHYLLHHIYGIIPYDADTGKLKFSQIGAIASLSAFWTWLTNSFFPGVLMAMPAVPIVTALWAMDMIVGTVNAIWDKKWDSRECRRGVGKWALWMFVLIMCAFLRAYHILGAEWVTSLMAAYICYTELGSIFKNLGKLFGNRELEDSGQGLQDFGQGFQDRLTGQNHREEDQNKREVLQNKIEVQQAKITIEQTQTTIDQAKKSEE